MGAPSHPVGWDAHSYTAATSGNAAAHDAHVAGVAAVVGVSQGDAWGFTRLISPRRLVRVRGFDSKASRWAFKAGHPCTDDAPGVPWAIHLAGDDLLFAFLAFDFDAKAGDAALQGQYAARADAAAHRLAEILTELGIEFSVCASGPGGGRHVLVALSEHLPVETVAHLARTARAVFGGARGPLDITPMTNAKRGLIRPPGSPHPRGGRSEWIGGHPLTVLAAPSTTAAQVAALQARLEALVPAADSSAGDPVAHRTATDLDPAQRRVEPLAVAVGADGAPYLPGRRRPLPRRQLERAHTPLSATDDGSAVVFRLLCSAARCHWTLRQVIDELAPLPGMEHLRTVRVDGARVPRAADGGTQSTAAVLAADWRRAVDRIATRELPATPLTPGGEVLHGSAEEAFAADAAAIADAIEHLENRAAVSCGRWDSRLGAIDREVLTVLLKLATGAMKLTVAASIRTVAIEAGCGRESARLALRRLEADAWIAQASDAVGTDAAEWELLPYGRDYDTALPGASPAAQNTPPGSIHRETGSDRSHQHTGGARGDSLTAPALRQAVDGATRREVLLDRLTTTQDLFRHDCFVPDYRGGLGARAGWVFAHLPETPTPVETLGIPGISAAAVERSVAELVEAGLALVCPEGVLRAAPEARDAYARFVGTDGIGAARAEQYAIESQVWSWWCSEEQAVTARGRAPGRGRTDSGRARIRDGQLALPVAMAPAWADLPPYPRRHLGRPDHRRAYRIVAERRAAGTLHGSVTVDAA